MVAARRLPPVAGLMVALLVLAGCGGPPAGVDRDLVGDWLAMPEPVQMVPAAGACLDNDYKQNVGLRLYDKPVDCTERHSLETIHVGRFDEAEVTDRDEAPDPGTARWRDAFQQCDEADDDYLGADFRYGDLWMGVGVPQDQAWEAGARWFRCDLIEPQNFFQSPLWPDTLRGSLSEEATLRPGLVLGCFTVEVGETVGELRSIEFTGMVVCSEPHEAEFVGVWHSNQRDYPEADGDWATVHENCREIVADYIGVTPSFVTGVLRVTTIVRGMGQTDWDNGDRGFRCFLHVNDESVSRSLDGLGTGAAS